METRGFLGRRSIAFSYLILLSIPVAVSAAPKTDVIIFENGDRLTGEVKSLERGRLRFNTDATGTIAIEWDDIAYLESDQNIQVETEQGERYLGHISRGGTEFQTVIETRSGPIELESMNVVLMTPIEERGVSRLDGDVTAGYNFAKSSEVQQLHFGLDMNYRTETRIFGFEADATISDSETSETNQRQSVDLNYTRLLQDRWIMGGALLLDRNDQLGIDLRTSIAVGGGRILRQSNSTNLAIQGGLQLSRENTSGGTSSEDTVEAFGSLHWDWFRYDSPELDLSSELKIIPNLTETGRGRGELDISLKWEMIEDLFWELSFYDAYDSDPVVPGAEKNDFGVNTSLGYEF